MPKKGKIQKWSGFYVNTAIESYEFTDFKNVENFEEKKN